MSGGADDGDPGTRRVHARALRSGLTRPARSALRLDPVARTLTLTPCLEIGSRIFEERGDETDRRFDVLTTPMPLVGGDMLLPGSGGLLRLVDAVLERVPWHGEALRPIARQLLLALYAGRPWLHWRPLLLWGPPGSGKSHLARTIAEVSGGFSAILDLAGTTDARTLEGTARGWLSAQPCWPVLMMARSGIANPLLILEEVDKARQSGNGSALDVLLTMLEPSTAARYFDRYLLSEIDLSQVCWVLTCNDPRRLPSSLLSRLEVVQVPPPAPRHFGLLLVSLIASARRRMGLADEPMPAFARWVGPTLMRAYLRHRSVRRLARQVDDLLPLAPELLTGPRH
jgi:hypothetical protein